MVLECNEGKVTGQEDGSCRGEGGLKEERVQFCSPLSVCSLSYSASRRRVWPNILTTNHIQEQACPFFRKVVFPSNALCLCLQTAVAGSLQQLTAPAVQSWSKENHHKPKQFFFCPFMSIQVVSRASPGPLRYVTNSPGFLLASSALAYWEYLNY